MNVETAAWKNVAAFLFSCKKNALFPRKWHNYVFFFSNLLLLLTRDVLEIQILLCLIRNISLMVIQCEVIIKVMKSIPRRNVMFSSCSMLMIAVVGMPRGSRYHRVPELDKICFISLLTPCSVWELSLCYDSEKCSTIHACLIVER